MKKPKRRYTDPLELMRLIDHAKSKAHMRYCEANYMDASADSFVRESTKYESDVASSMVHRADRLREAAKKKRIRANYFMQKAHRLGKALAELRTVPMVPVLGADASVLP